MLIIDSQVHIWAPETAEKPYAREDASPPHRPVPIGATELLREMDGAGVARCVLVPPTWEADRNDTSLEAARLYPDRFRVMIISLSTLKRLISPFNRLLIRGCVSPKNFAACA